MQIKSLTLQNFRRYSNAVTIEFENLTAFVGKNDVGKSSILEALDIFFNDGRGCIKLDKDDINKIEASRGNNEVSIAVCFENLPDTVVIDATNETTLESEYLLNESCQLEIVKNLTYTRPLTKRQASDYELRPAPDNPDRPRSIREQMKTAVKQVEADRGQAAPKKNAPDRGDR